MDVRFRIVRITDANTHFFQFISPDNVLVESMHEGATLVFVGLGGGRARRVGGFTVPVLNGLVSTPHYTISTLIFQSPKLVPFINAVLQYNRLVEVIPRSSDHGYDARSRFNQAVGIAS